MEGKDECELPYYMTLFHMEMEKCGIPPISQITFFNIVANFEES